MQIYAIKMFNFFRFGEKNNSVVLDLLPSYKGKDLDDVYEEVRKNPVTHIREVKKMGITNLMGISGVVGSNYDYSNGTGKSTVLEAICYALYDQVVRRTANTDKVATASMSVVTRFNGELPKELKETYVELIFEESGRIYRLKRGRSVKKLTDHSPILEFVDVTGVEDSQAGHRSPNTNESIAKVINLDYEVFINSVMFGQSDAGAFLTGTDKKRKEMLINLLHLENVVSGCLKKVRDRKNDKQKVLDALNAQIQLISDSLKLKSSVDVLSKQIDEKKSIIVDCDKKTEAYQKEIDTLSKSDILKEMETIRVDATKIKTDLEDKKKQRDGQTMEWMKLSANCSNSAEKKEKDVLALLKKQSDVTARIEANKKTIASFDMEKKKADLVIVEKAKKAKPVFVEEIAKLEAKKEELSNSLSSTKTTMSIHRNEIVPLKNQLSKDGDQFVCDKCKSLVSKKHIESELAKNEEILKSLTTECAKIQTEHDEVQKTLSEKKKKYSNVEEWLIKEGKINAEIQEFNNCKSKETEFASSLKDVAESIEKMTQEQVELAKQKEEYQRKSSEISSKYDTEILVLTNKLKELADKYKVVKDSAGAINAKIAQIKTHIETVSANKSSHNSQIGSLHNEIETINNDTKRVEDLRAKLTQETAVMGRLLILEDCFGLEGIQTRIVTKYLPLLNIYVKEFVDILSNGAMTVKLYVNSKSKIDIAITGGSADTFIMSSGGEKMIIRMAVDIGLALLSFTRCSQKPEVICLDEVFGPLDNSHINAVFNLLKKLQDKFTRVLVISHKAEINELIPHQLLVEKDEGVFGRSRIKEIV